MNNETFLFEHIESLKTLNYNVLNRFNDLPYHEMSIKSLPDQNGFIELIVYENLLTDINKIFKTQIVNKIRKLKFETFIITQHVTEKYYTIRLHLNRTLLTEFTKLINNYKNKVEALSSLELQKELNDCMTINIINTILKKKDYGSYNTNTDTLILKEWLKYDYIEDILHYFLNNNISYSISYSKKYCNLQPNSNKGVEYIKTYLQFKLLEYTAFEELKFHILINGRLSV